MSVASKMNTKMVTTVVLGLVAALSILPTWASTTPGMSSLTTVTPVVSTSSNQDLWELRTRLKDRFSWIATEVRSLITTDHVVTDEDDILSESPDVRTFDVRQNSSRQSLRSHQDYFIDIQDDPYKLYINRLAAYGVLCSSQKFFPQNYFLVDDFVFVLSKLYKKTTGLSLTSQDILWISSVDGVMTKGMLQQIMYSLKNIDPIDMNGNPYDKLVRSEWAYYLVRLFDLPALDTCDISSFPLPNWFTDIADQPFASAIATLANLGIVNTDLPKFYPNNYVRHYDFVILLINAFMSSQEISLPSTPHTTQFADVDTTASYFPQFSYAFDHGIIDRITVSKWWQLFFQPNKFLTKHDVYHICSKVAPVQFVHNDYQADQQKISRAELSELLVACFDLKAKEISPSPSVSWTTLDSSDLSVLMKLKTLFSML